MGTPSPRAKRLFRLWAARKYRGVSDLPDLDLSEVVRLGRCLRLDYASDKWKRPGRVQEYTHDFDGGPEVLATVDGCALVIVFSPRKRFVYRRGLTG